MWNDGLGMKIRGKRKDIRNFLDRKRKTLKRKERSRNKTSKLSRTLLAVLIVNVNVNCVPIFTASTGNLYFTLRTL